MTDDSKSFEKKLDRDFLFYLNLSKNLLQNLRDEEKQLCEVWLTHLLGKSVSSLAEKCDRNIYLSRLLLQMQNSKLTEVFLETPPSGALPSAFETFHLPTEVDGLKGFEELGFQVDSSIGGGSGDFFETSRDGRTYLATRRLPKGVMAYIAVTNNEGEPAWIPQKCPARPGTSQGRPGTSGNKAGGRTKKLLDCIDVPVYKLRKSPEERASLLELMDKIIDDCNKWLQGEDPHNAELEELFKMIYDEYSRDPEKAELLKHPLAVRNTLIRDIRDRISERRAEISRREMVLDQYESSQFVDVGASQGYLDEVWLERASKPLSDSVRATLEAIYPADVIEKFTEFLFHERLLIVQKGEIQVRNIIGELRKASIDDNNKELQKLKKARNDYKEYCDIYNEMEKKAAMSEKERKEKCSRTPRTGPQDINKYKQEMEALMAEAKRNFDRERRLQHDLEEKLFYAVETYAKFFEQVGGPDSKIKKEIAQYLERTDSLKAEINILKQRKAELTRRLQEARNGCG